MRERDKPLIVAPHHMQRRLVAESIGLESNEYVHVHNATRLRGLPPDRKIYFARDRFGRALDPVPSKEWREILEGLAGFTNVEYVDI